MKKSLLAVAVAALSANAFAVNLDDNTGIQTYASEIAVTSAGTLLEGLEADVTAGFALATDGYVRFTLTNGATFAGAPALTTTGASAFSVASGGDGQNFVIFRTDGNGIAIDEVLSLAADVEVVNKGAVGVSYSLFETASDAVAQAGALSNQSGTLLNFASALLITAVDANPANIDAVNAASKEFTSGDNTNLVTLTVDAAPGDQLLADGSGDTAVADVLTNASKWTLSGNFSAAVDTTGIAAGGNNFTQAADKQSAELTGAAVIAAAPLTVLYTVTTDDDIAETPVSATFTPAVNAGYEAAPINFANITRLEKNGVTIDVDLALKPAGAFRNYVRITNKDTIPGAFFIKVINDAGESVSFPLSDVDGQPATLGAGASTTQMTIDQIFAAASAQGLALSGQGKLRLEVTGQTNDLDVQSYTVATDGTTFATF